MSGNKQETDEENGTAQGSCAVSGFMFAADSSNQEDSSTPTDIETNFQVV